MVLCGMRLIFRDSLIPDPWSGSPWRSLQTPLDERMQSLDLTTEKPAYEQSFTDNDKKKQNMSDV